MSNHAHIVFRPVLNERTIRELKGTARLEFESDAPPLSAIMQSLKGYTARKANILLNRTGNFWQDESYDHEARDEEELDRIVKYVLNNPVKAGLVENWRDWQ